MNKEPSGTRLDSDDIDELVREFFRAFARDAGGKLNLARIRSLFIAEGLIIKASGVEPEIMSVEAFIAPREKLLSEGRLTDFSEREESHVTQIFGNIAQRFSTYRKSGSMDGMPFTTRGMKTMQFVRVAGAWRMAALAWDDERDGLTIATAA